MHYNLDETKMNLTHLSTCQQHLDKMYRTWQDFIAKNPNCCTTCYGGGCESCHGSGLCPFCMTEARKSCGACGWSEKNWIRFDRRPPNEVFDCVCREDTDEYEEYES